MSSVITDKQEREKKAAILEERKRREKRRMKELNGVNGIETPEDEEETAVPGERAGHLGHLPIRGHANKGSRSAFNGPRSGSPPAFNGQGGAGSTRDSFLNYFFGKEGQMPSGSNTSAPGSATLPDRPGSRHVSQNIEPSFAASIRRGDTRAPERHVLEMVPDDIDNTPAMQIYENSFPLENEAPALTEREALETELIRRLISSYFNIVRETIADQVPKAVMHLLVNHSKDVVQNRLVSELYREDLFQELLYEDDTIKAEREKCEKLLKTYKEAAKIVGEVL